MARDIIHPEYPFTEQEHAAACVILGVPARDAVAGIADLKAGLAETEARRFDDSGWFTAGPSVHCTASFGAAIHLAADILSHGEILSQRAREAWLEEWTIRLSGSELETRLDQLQELGGHVARHAPAFRRLLGHGIL